ncbi:carboxypeptidase-like regulatory domain-containing protein [Sphingobacterium puteale]|nr:carboxypeptidase-like regulatory domain-containing protein [Sphingobacterium puteale]
MKPSNEKKTKRWIQTTTIRGRVLDGSTGQALAGISVSVKDTRNSTSTDANGNFAIGISGQNGVLVFTSLGYQRKELYVNVKQGDVTVRLQATHPDIFG